MRINVFTIFCVTLSCWTVVLGSGLYNDLLSCSIGISARENQYFGGIKLNIGGMFFGSCIYKESIISGSVKCLIDKEVVNLIGEYKDGNLDVIGTIEALLATDCRIKKSKSGASLLTSIEKDDLLRLIQDVGSASNIENLTITGLWIHGQVCSKCASLLRDDALSMLGLDSSVCEYCSPIWRQESYEQIYSHKVDQKELGDVIDDDIPASIDGFGPEERAIADVSGILAYVGSLVNIDGKSNVFVSGLRVNNSTHGIALLGSKGSYALVAIDLEIFKPVHTAIIEAMTKKGRTFGHLCRVMKGGIKKSEIDLVMFDNQYLLWVAKSGDALSISGGNIQVVRERRDQDHVKFFADKTKAMNIKQFEGIEWGESGIQGGGGLDVVCKVLN